MTTSAHTTRPIFRGTRGLVALFAVPWLLAPTTTGQGMQGSTFALAGPLSTAPTRDAAVVPSVPATEGAGITCASLSPREVDVRAPRPAAGASAEATADDEATAELQEASIAPPPARAAMARAARNSFTFAVGDRLELRLFERYGGEPGGQAISTLVEFREVSGDDVVQEDGTIFLPLLGAVRFAHFSAAAATPEGRERLAASAVATFLDDHGDVFDGVDLDWEYPVEGGLASNGARPEDRRNFTELVATFRRALDARGATPSRRPRLTIATAASPWLMRNLEVEALAGLVDWIGVMTYDYAVGAPETGFNAPLFAVDPEAPSVAATIDAYLAAGAPPERLVLGIPFYARAFAGVAPGPGGDGLGQPARGAAPAPWGPDTVDWRRLVAADPTAHGFERHWHEVARVPWLYDREQGIWISHDDPRSVRHKAAYAALRGLRGVMIWELGGDDGRLVAAVAAGLAAVPQPAGP